MGRQIRQERGSIEARRAAVSDGLVRRKSYHRLAAELGVSYSTVAGDVKALRAEWKKSRGEVNEIFEQTAHDQDHLQEHMLGLLDMLAPEDQASVLGKILGVLDQRAKLFDLYPRSGKEGGEVPTGPLEVRIEFIDAGNRQLVTNSLEKDDDDQADDFEG